MAFDVSKIEKTVDVSLDKHLSNPKMTNNQRVNLKNIHFKTCVLFSNKYSRCFFENCFFEKGLEFDIPPGTSSGKVTRVFDFDIYLKDCRIDNLLNMSDCTFENKVRIHDCEVHNAVVELKKEHPEKKFGVCFNNTTFNDLADFWKTTFHPKVIFYKTDFNSTTVFSMVTFKQNTLFTYTLLAGKSIFAKTEFKQGLDLSQAIISGELQLFDLMFKKPNFSASYISDKKDYQQAIDKDGIIPLENKKETFRIIKAQAETNKNYVDSTRYHNYEYKAFRKLAQNRFFSDRWLSQLTNIPIIILNKISNNYGSSFIVGLLFTITTGILFLSIIVFGYLGQTPICDWNYIDWELVVQFFNPIHKMDIYKASELPSIVYLIDFFGRIAVGYGIYQTVQAFRKFK